MINNHGQARKAIRRVTLPRAPFPVVVRVRDELEVVWSVPDRDVEGVTRHIFMPFKLKLPCTEEQFFRQVLDAVAHVFVHEAKEALLVDGVRIFDPVEDHPKI